MSCFAAMARASSGRLMIFGTTRAARMPRMTTTTITSSNVKPRCIRVPISTSYGKLNYTQALEYDCTAPHIQRVALVFSICLHLAGGTAFEERGISRNPLPRWRCSAWCSRTGAGRGSRRLPRRARRPQLEAAGRASSAGGLFGSAKQGPGAAAAASSAIRLLGVVAASGDRRGHAVLRLDAKKTVAVLQGEDVEPGLRLAEVHADHIVLERNGARETLAWPEKSRK